MSTKEEEIRRKAMGELLKMLGESYNSEAVPSVLGAERGRIIARVTGCKDPYKKMKLEANKRALELLPKIKKFIKERPEDEQLRISALISCLGNVLDYDVPGSNSDIDSAMELLHEDFFIDDIDMLKSKINENTEVLFFTDNAGEIGFDTLLVEELKKIGAKITVAVKGGPSLNDATIHDSKMVGMEKIVDEVITTGIDAIGIRLDESPEWFLDRFYSTDLIIAKGMANWETLSETPVPCPTMFIFRTKCEPVALSLNAPENKCIAKLVEKGWKL
jgi:uncharacterized protein with ATP-grasp and redox domains